MDRSKYKKMRQISDGLLDVYGPIEWITRRKAIDELVYTILSQHTSDVNSERAFANLMSEFGDFDSVADADEKEIEITIRSGGLSKSKAPRIKKVLNEIRAEVGSFDLSFLSEMPMQNAKEWLMKFNGIGPKTAAIILCFSFQMPAMPVDTHIFRVSKRLGLIGKKITAEKAHDLLERVVPSAEVFQFHMFLIRHGRDTCKARRPSCDVCVLSHICPSFGRI
jgi:endonuclease-3|tara:strand:- start:1387 stop:2052 length:666 start_codon:yes stop_codon:yes gene_type:complete